MWVLKAKQNFQMKQCLYSLSIRKVLNVPWKRLLLNPLATGADGLDEADDLT